MNLFVLHSVTHACNIFLSLSQRKKVLIQKMFLGKWACGSDPVIFDVPDADSDPNPSYLFIEKIAYRNSPSKTSISGLFK